MADAGDDNPSRVIEIIRACRCPMIDPDGVQAFSDGGEIAGAVVEQGDLQSSPLVEGRTVRSRRSREQANLNARANALKTASTL